MNEKDLKILERYDLQIKNIYRGRGSYICETPIGPVLFKEYQGSVQKLEFIEKICSRMMESGHLRADSLIRNKEEELVTVDKDELKYIVKVWTTGKECEAKDEDDVERAIANLAGLHNELRGIPAPEFAVGPEIEVIYQKHRKELRKINNYLKDKKKKTKFELYLSKNFRDFYAEAEKAFTYLQTGFAKKSMENAIVQGEICHGEYNQHNVIMEADGVFTANFDRCSCGVQMEDLYYFMRKILEKSSWDLDMAKKMLDVYDLHKPLQKEELQNLYIRFCFPEKFWKIANYYYNSRKSYLFERSTDKLQAIIRQRQDKEKFLNYLSQNL